MWVFDSFRLHISPQQQQRHIRFAKILLTGKGVCDLWMDPPTTMKRQFTFKMKKGRGLKNNTKSSWWIVIFFLSLSLWASDVLSLSKVQHQSSQTVNRQCYWLQCDTNKLLLTWTKSPSTFKDGTGSRKQMWLLLITVEAFAIVLFTIWLFILFMTDYIRGLRKKQLEKKRTKKNCLLSKFFFSYR